MEVILEFKMGYMIIQVVIIISYKFSLFMLGISGTLRESLRSISFSRACWLH